MSNYVENLNDLIVAKKEIKSIIKDAGVEPGDVFSYYPAYIRAAIAGGGTIFDPDDYYTIDYIDENFVSYSYLAAALEDIDVDVDLDDYPTYTYLYTYVGDALNEYAPDLTYYPTFDDISDMGYITAADVPEVDLDDYPTYTYLYTYVGDALNEYAPDLTYYPTFDDISDMGYITAADVDLTDYPTFDDISDMGYITAADVPEVNLSYVLSTYNLRYINETPFGNGKQLYLNNSGLGVADSGAIFPQTYSYSQIVSYLSNDSSRLWIGGPTMKNYVEGRIAELESSSVTPSYLADNYVSYGYASANYVSYSYAYNTFVSYSYLGDLEEITEYILGSGSSSAPENVYATKTELGAYVSKIELSNLSYATEQYVDDEISNIDIPVINENLIPKENATYTLGDLDHFYTNTYSTNLYLSNIHGFRNNSNLSFYAYVAGSERYVFSQSGFYPVQSNRSLGQNNNNNKWGAAYISNLYADTAYLQDTSYTKTLVPNGSDTYTLGDSSNYYHTLYSNRIRGNSSVNFVAGGNNRVTVTGTAMRPMLQNYNLGSSDYPFATAYISNIYNFIWTGTSAEYAALDNYTSYQFYFIKEV